MLDVHPAHHAANSWRDFFVHIATIALGLLIAVGLEQTVEWVHHRHQLHQLEEDLHAEGLRNLHVALDNIAYMEQVRNYYAAQYAELVRASRAHRAPAGLTPHLPKGVRYIKPAYAVWTVAQQSGTLGLLPREDAQRYVRLYSVVQMAADRLDIMNDASRQAAVSRFPGVSDPSTSDAFLAAIRSPEGSTYALLDPEDLRRARDSLGRELAAYRFSISTNVNLYGIEWASLHGSRSDEENVRILYDAASLYNGSGVAALLAKYPMPDAPAQNTEPEQQSH
jgi:hypothetical protein